MVDVSIIIVNYNVKDYLEQALRSVRRAVSGLSAEVFVVDNHSSDGSETLFVSDFPEVHFIRNDVNVGFARANNQAMEMASGRYLLLLNPDTIIQEDTLQVMIRFMDAHPEAGAAGCRVLNPDGSLQLACRRSFPTPAVAFFKLVGLSRLFPRSRLFGRYNLTYLDPDETHEVDAISGSFMFVRREVVAAVGHLDEDFFLFGEDLDWCYRIENGGWKIFYIPDTQIIHFKGESIRRSQISSLLTFYQAMYIFVQKHMRRRYLVPLQWIITLGIVLKGGLTLAGKLLARAAVLLADLVCVNAAMLAAIVLRFGALIPLPPYYSIKSYLVFHGVCSAIWLSSFAATGLYGQKKYSVSRAFTASLLGALILGFIYLLSFEQYGFSRKALVYVSVLIALCIPGWRMIFRLVSRQSLRRSMVRRRAIVVGTDETGQALLGRLRRHQGIGYDVVGLVNGSGMIVGSQIEGIPVLGTVEDLPRLVAETRADEVILSTESLPYHQTLRLISSLHDPRVHIKLAPSPLEVMIGRTSIESLDPLPLVEISEATFNARQRFSKRFFDLAVGSAALILVSPVLVWQLVLSFSSRGHFSFRATALRGENGTRLVLREFVEDDSDRRPSLMYRLMKTGGLHRALWLWHVVRGDLSLVGPPAEGGRDFQEIDGMKPGLVGLVEMDESELSAEEQLKYELFYRRNRSTLLDGEILARSVWQRLAGKKE